MKMTMTIMVTMAMAMLVNCVLQVIHIYNRHADLVEQLRLPGMCSCFGWDKVNTWLVDDGNNISGGGMVPVMLMSIIQSQYHYQTRYVEFELELS